MARFRFGAHLYEGGFGTICEIACLDDGWVGVAKRLKEPYDPEDLARFRREVRLQAQLSHPNVMRIRAMKVDCDQPWFAMEKADFNMRQYIEAHGPSASLLPLFLQVARAVEYANHAGIIHRDLKPENILVFQTPGMRSDSAVVSDFGLGRHFEQTTLTLTSTAVGMGPSHTALRNRLWMPIVPISVRTCMDSERYCQKCSLAECLSR